MEAKSCFRRLWDRHRNYLVSFSSLGSTYVSQKAPVFTFDIQYGLSDSNPVAHSDVAERGARIGHAIRGRWSVYI